MAGGDRGGVGITAAVRATQPVGGASSVEGGATATDSPLAVPSTLDARRLPHPVAGHQAATASHGSDAGAVTRPPPPPPPRTPPARSSAIPPARTSRAGSPRRRPRG